MRTRLTLVHSLLFASVLSGLATAAVPGTAVAATTSNSPPKIDLVIAVDVSGSMRGLIDATRLKLWDVVRLLGRAQPTPQIRVGLVSFGGKHYDASGGYVRKELDLTTDLDAVAARLFALQIEGSREYVARAVQTSTRSMSWSQDSQSLKILFVAGNESAHQDPLVTLSSALVEARQRGIHVNTIFCGKPGASDALAWRQAATLGGGEFAAIDHNATVIAQATPYDAELARLSSELSRTYVAYGSGGKVRHANQLAQDERARKDGLAVAAERAAAKAAPTYANADWDAVDAYEKTRKPTEVDEPTLKAKLEERKKLRTHITELAARREAFLAAQAPGRQAALASLNPYGGAVGGDAGATRGTGSASAAPAVAAPSITATSTLAAASTPAVPATASPPAPSADARPATATPVPMASLRRAPTDAAAPAAARLAPRAKPAKAASSQASMDDAFSGAVKRNAEASGYSF